MQQVADYVIKNWLAKVAFEDMAIHGLLKAYQIRTNSANNIILMGQVLNKFFRLDSQPYDDDIMEPFNQLYLQKKEKIKVFYVELIDIPEVNNLKIDTLFYDQSKQKFQHHCMCLTLP